ncbi:MAG TPA: SH3 domain-containing protein [Caldilineae bacterium]|nr:SH3 domain-containing protein [Caldilineae bacterium]
MKRVILLVVIALVVIIGALTGLYLYGPLGALSLPWITPTAAPTDTPAPTPTAAAVAPTQEQATPTPIEPTPTRASREAETPTMEAMPTPTEAPTQPPMLRPRPTPTPLLIRFKAFVAPLRTELKAEPRLDADVVAMVRGGQVLDMVGRTEPPTWVLVIYPPDSEGRAWIPVGQLRIYNDVTLLPVVEEAAAVLVTATPTPETTVTPVVTQPVATRPPIALTARITADVLNVRAGPSTEYAIISKLRNGDQVQVVGRNEEGTWLLVIYDEATEAQGWIFAQYADVSGDVQEAPVATSTAQPGLVRPGRSRFTGRLAILTRSGGDLYIVNADGSGLRKVTTGVLDPALSPDGTHVAYARWPGGPDPEGIYVRDLTNDNEWRVWGTHLPRTPDWSPDGRYLVFSFQKGGREGYEEVRRCWGPFCFSHTLGPSPNWRLGHVDTWTGEYRDVPSLLYSRNPSWAPDGQRIVYRGDRGFEVTTLSGPSRALTKNLNHENPVWSPAGGLIAFEYKFNDHADIFVMNEDGTGIRPLTVPDLLSERPANNVSPTWSPDGQWIAFLTDRNGQWEIYVMRPDGSEQQPLFPDGLPGVTIQHQLVGERLLSWSR